MHYLINNLISGHPFVANKIWIKKGIFKADILIAMWIVHYIKQHMGIRLRIIAKSNSSCYWRTS